MPLYVCYMDAGQYRLVAGLPAKSSHHFIPCGYQEYDESAPSVPAGMAAIHRFRAGDDEAAREYWLERRRTGCPPDWNFVGEAPGGEPGRPENRTWHFRDRLNAAIGSVGRASLPANIERASRANEHYRYVARMLGELCGTYHRCRRDGGVAVMTPQDRAQAHDALRRIDAQVAALAVQAQAAAEAVEPAHRAFGSTPKIRVGVAIERVEEPDDAGLPPPAGTDPNPIQRKKAASAGK